MGSPLSEEISRNERLAGWVLSAGITYLAQALVWAIVWSILILGPDNQASAHWVLKMGGGFFFGLMIGLIPAGLIFIAAYSVPGALLWAAASHDTVWWMRRPAVSCLVGAFLGIAAVGLLMAMGQLSNALDHWLSVVVLGGLYGIATAIACVFVARKIIRKSNVSS